MPLPLRDEPPTADEPRPAGRAAPVSLHVAAGLRGWMHGIGPHTLLACFEGPTAPDAGAEDELQQQLTPQLPRPDAPQQPAAAAVDALLYWSAAVLHASRLPVFSVGRELRRERARGRWLVLPVAGEDLEASRMALGWAMRCLFGGIGSDERRRLTQALLPSLAMRAGGDRNTWPFVLAARALDMPATLVDARWLQIGWGSQQRVLNGSFTDRTPAVAAVAARDKLLSAQLLRRAGLPVPAQRLVATADEAAAAAAQLGYPVVVKPVALDGGVGVAAGLRDEATLRRAFARAAELSSRLLVERHVEGEDHRLMTFQGQLIWAIVRHPAAVVGDGLSTVRELLARLNADPRRGTHAQARLRVVDLDDEALELLHEQGMAPDAVPAAGQVLRLRRTANLNRGGTATAVNERVHPDNRELALQAAEVLGLDIAGVDLLLPDIARSWRESGGAICEVNGQPQLGGNLQQHLHGLMLQGLVSRQGRIPVLMVVGRPQPWIEALVQGWVRALVARGRRVGLARRDAAWLHTPAPRVEALGRHRSLLAATTALLAHRRCDALLAWAEDERALGDGVAFDRADALAWCGPVDDGDGLRQLQALLRPPAGTLQLFNRDCPACVALADADGAGAAHGGCLPAAAEADWVARLLQRCEPS